MSAKLASMLVSSLQEFVEICRQECVEYAVAANLAMVRDVSREVFDQLEPRIDLLLRQLGHPDFEVPGFEPIRRYPYSIPNRIFWRSFFSKQRDSTSRRSTVTQLLHMMNPVFFADVVRIISCRSVRGGVYEQN